MTTSDRPVGWSRPGYEISTDPDRIDRTTIREALNATYWWDGALSAARFDAVIAGSLVFAIYEMPNGRTVGFGRVVSDRASFAWVSDVIVLEPWRGRGLGRWIMECILAHPDLQALRRWLLATRDAHDLYRPLGFEDPPAGRFMVRSGTGPAAIPGG